MLSSIDISFELELEVEVGNAKLLLRVIASALWFNFSAVLSTRVLIRDTATVSHNSRSSFRSAEARGGVRMMRLLRRELLGGIGSRGSDPIAGMHGMSWFMAMGAKIGGAMVGTSGAARSSSKVKVASALMGAVGGF